MSGAIFGKINLKKLDIDKNVADSMMDKLNIYKLDDKKVITLENMCMGCGLIHVAEEDKNEILPYYDKENNLIITADAIIDNREELINVLYNHNPDEVITDSQLILRAYKKWKYDCPKHLLGDYSFVIFDKENTEIFCATDYAGCRTLYYKLIDGVFSFSTVIKPIYEGEEFNERWISDFLAMPVVLHQSESEETIYTGIYQMEAATTMVINSNGIKKFKYWDPVRDSKKIHYNSDEDYVKEFKRIFSEAVRCRLRTNYNIGISMSGGIDSTSVACVAAEILKKRNKNIISFTSVPDKSFVDDTSRDSICDESRFVELTKKMHDNIEINYCRSEGKDSFSEMDTLLKVLEGPYKTYQNSFWCFEIMNRCAKKGCKVLLTGQFGNYTISYGDFFTNMKTLLKDRRYIKFFKEIVGCSKLHNISYMFTLKYVIKTIMPHIFNSNSKDKESNNKIAEYSPINEKLISKWNIEERFKKRLLVLDKDVCNDMYADRRFMADPLFFTQIATIETKYSLFNGIIQRDPTKDKRIIEFCFGLSGDQYVRNGLDRYLIRRAMKDIIPDEIRMLQGQKGLQGADWLQRMQTKHDEIYNALSNCIDDKLINKYLNIDKIKKQKELMKNKKLDDKELDIGTIMTATNLYKFFTL